MATLAVTPRLTVRGERRAPEAGDSTVGGVTHGGDLAVEAEDRRRQRHTGPRRAAATCRWPEPVRTGQGLVATSARPSVVRTRRGWRNSEFVMGVAVITTARPPAVSRVREARVAIRPPAELYRGRAGHGRMSAQPAMPRRSGVGFVPPWL